MSFIKFGLQYTGAISAETAEFWQFGGGLVLVAILLLDCRRRPRRTAINSDAVVAALIVRRP